VENFRKEVRSIEAGLIRIMGTREELDAVRMETTS
jgi:multicomponent Na+:H+ antiporter subunit E